MLQKRNTPVLRFRNLIFKDVLGVLEDWGFDHIKCFTFITQVLEGHKISLKIRITGSNGLTNLTCGIIVYQRYLRSESHDMNPCVVDLRLYYLLRNIWR